MTPLENLIWLCLFRWCCFCDPGLRSNTAVAVKFKEGVEEQAVLDAVTEAGFETGLGYGHLRGTMIRFSEFPIHTPEDHKALIQALEKVKVVQAVRT